jgi:alkylated DNA repair protein (DNA oxidative demethylase)
MELDADIAILNFYDAEGRMGLHQDKDETAGSIDAGIPIVSISLGDRARFLFGGLRRKDPVQTILLESGDGFVFGGPARLRYHGVSRILPETAPPELALAGRFNLTFRRF